MENSRNIDAHLGRKLNPREILRTYCLLRKIEIWDNDEPLESGLIGEWTSSVIAPQQKIHALHYLRGGASKGKYFPVSGPLFCTSSNRRAETFCWLQRSTELMARAENTSDRSIWIIYVGLQSFSDRIETEAVKEKSSTLGQQDGILSLPGTVRFA